MRALILVVCATGVASADTPAPADTRCGTPPPVMAKGWRHKRSSMIARSGSPNHRGIDLIASEQDDVQTFRGKLAYGKLDKDVDDEDVEVFACLDNGWKSLGTARTDDDGRFELKIASPRSTPTGSARSDSAGPRSTPAGLLPVGMRDLYVAALGDGSGAYFVGYVAPRGSGVIVTDVDGTISWSENSIIKTVISRSRDIKHRPNAPEALRQVKYPIVYVTARGDVFIDVTRKWLERHGFPRGLLRLSHGAFARPGAKAVEYKKRTFAALAVPILAGIGNRKSDITAYTTAGLPGSRIFIHLPEFAKEVRADLAAGNAVGFSDYLELPKLLP
jgi:hypothetical protein